MPQSEPHAVGQSVLALVKRQPRNQPACLQVWLHIYISAENSAQLAGQKLTVHHTIAILALAVISFRNALLAVFYEL